MFPYTLNRISRQKIIQRRFLKYLKICETELVYFIKIELDAAPSARAQPENVKHTICKIDYRKIFGEK